MLALTGLRYSFKFCTIARKQSRADLASRQFVSFARAAFLRAMVAR
jgi:hypothetical protein